jgi:hypothetical protein
MLLLVVAPEVIPAAARIFDRSMCAGEIRQLL